MQIIAIILLSIAGLFTANKIRLEKSRSEKISCPLDGQCEIVLKSRYAKFLGIPLEYSGLLFYSALIIIFSALMIWPESEFSMLGVIALFAVAFGVLFSLYLIFIEKFILKAWCTWCLYSALTTFVIFVVSIFYFWGKLNLSAIVNQYGLALFWFDSILVAITTSVVIINEFITFRFLKDFRISEAESDILNILWQFIWVCLVTVSVSSYLLTFNTDPEILISPNRLLQILGVVILSALSSWWLLPKIHHASQHTNLVRVSFVASMRIILITLGAILIGNWILLPATNLSAYLFVNIILAILANLILFYLDRVGLRKFARS